MTVCTLLILLYNVLFNYTETVTMRTFIPSLRFNCLGSGSNDKNIYSKSSFKLLWEWRVSMNLICRRRKNPHNIMKRLGGHPMATVDILGDKHGVSLIPRASLFCDCVDKCGEEGYLRYILAGDDCSLLGGVSFTFVIE